MVVRRAGPSGPAKPKQPAGVVFVDPGLVLRRQIDLFHGLQSNFHILHAPLCVERHVCREHYAVHAEEVDPASQRGNRSDRDRVGIEIMKVRLRMFRERDRFVTGACGLEKLVVPLADPLGCVRRKPAKMIFITPGEGTQNKPV